MASTVFLNVCVLHLLAIDSSTLSASATVFTIFHLSSKCSTEESRTLFSSSSTRTTFPCADIMSSVGPWRRRLSTFRYPSKWRLMCNATMNVELVKWVSIPLASVTDLASQLFLPTTSTQLYAQTWLLSPAKLHAFLPILYSTVCWLS